MTRQRLYLTAATIVGVWVEGCFAARSVSPWIVVPVALLLTWVAVWVILLRPLTHCDHRRAVTYQWLSSNGTPMVAMHCPDCGWRYQEGLSHDD